MSKHMPEVDSLAPVVDLGNEPVGISFDVKHGPFLYYIGGSKGLSYVAESFPDGSPSDPKPCVQGSFGIMMKLCRFFQFPPADHMHGLAMLRIMRIS
jgi:hypothetical protein